MNVIYNTLSVEVTQREDPGSYPNSLSSGPQASRDCVDYVEGEVRLEWERDDEPLTEEEITEFLKVEFPSVQSDCGELTVDILKWDIDVLVHVGKHIEILTPIGVAIENKSIGDAKSVMISASPMEWEEVLV